MKLYGVVTLTNDSIEYGWEAGAKVDTKSKLAVEKVIDKNVNE